MNLYFENLCKTYDGKTVFDNISGRIDEGDKIGIIGANGVGKTTLIRLILGIEEADKGRIQYPSLPLKTLYIEQSPMFSKDISVYEAVYNALMGSGVEVDEADMKVQKALGILGFPKEIWNQKAVNLSGGEKTKLLLCKMIVSDFDFLILDEPTNHLDMKTCQWLEEYLSSLKKTILVVSHDRYFLDKVVNRIWELSADRLEAYEGNYTDYKVQKEDEIKNIIKEYNKQQREIQNLKKVISERKNWYASAHKSAGQNDFLRAKAKKHASIFKAMERKLEKLEASRIDKPREAVSPAFDIINKNNTLEKLPPYLVKAQGITKYFNNRLIFKNISFNIRRGDKIALIGPNGTGKTTLLRIINNIDNEYEGDLTINPSIRVGYLDQELNNLDNKKTILENIMSQEISIGEARLLLACLLFRGDDVYKKVDNLSMGEKGRVAFAKLILSGANLLILDEPTNYMDILSKEKIEEVLQDFAGAVIFVSHDRYFIKRIANRIFRLEDKKLKCYDGDYNYYISKDRQENFHSEFSMDYNRINNEINRLENELAFLSGKLAQELEEEEKQVLDRRFIEIARQLNEYKDIIKNRKK